MNLVFTPQEMETFAARLQLDAAQKRVLAIIDTVRRSPIYVKAPEEEQARLDEAITATLDANQLTSWRELLQ